MKKKLVMMMAATACVAMMCGCGADAGKESAESTVQSETSVSGNGADVSGNESVMNINAEDYVTVGEYKGIEISVPGKVEYEESDYDIQTKSFYFNYINETEGVTDRPVALGDMTNIDYEGKKDGVAFEGGTAQGATLLIGSGQFIEGFEEGLVGVMPGETVDLNLKFPEAYHSAELAGQEVVFTVTVNFIPEMKDERVPELGINNVGTVEEFKQYVKDSMDKSAESDYLVTAGDAVIKQVVENSEFSEIPEAILEQNKQTYINYLNQMAAGYGMDGETFVTMYGGGQDYDTIVSEYALTYTKESLVAQVIAENEGLTLTDEELDARLAQVAEDAGITVETLYENGVTRENYRESYMYEDVLNFLVENAVNTVSE